MRYQQQFFDYFYQIVRYIAAQPLNLGGGAAPSGGDGGPPGGFMGMLPQTRIAYDMTEASTEFTPTPTISATLLDNLNHIRYRIDAVEAISSGIDIYQDGALVAHNVTIIDFIQDFEVTEIDTGHITVTTSISGIGSGETLPGTVMSGVFNEDLSAQCDGSNVTFDTVNAFKPGSLSVFYNGLKQTDDYVTQDADYNGFTLTFAPDANDELTVDYVMDTDGIGIFLSHIHSNYITYDYAEANYVTYEALLAYLTSGFVISTHNHVESDIIDLSHDADLIKGVTITDTPFNERDVLMYTTSSGWLGTSLLVKQQILFTIEGANLTSTDEGIKTLRVSAHDVGDYCTIDEVYCTLGTAPSTTALRVDIMKNGVSVFDINEYIEIPVGDTEASKSTDMSPSLLAKNDILQLELVQGDDDAADLVAHLRFSYPIALTL